ncbi:flavin reductase like domain-containing protein [Lipomyces oligophaga]|uniref:flavin reductase like domain-containing protein n=1 Tax=Lipomyces oligophaga TaxID=45792 RepID=UPI0034CE9EBA
MFVFAGSIRSVLTLSFRIHCIHTRENTSSEEFVTRYKYLMSRHAAPLAVITAASTTDFHAATVSSVTSLSVAGSGFPLVTFNLKLPSSTSQLIHASGRFSVNFLSGSEGAENIARNFAGGAASAGRAPKTQGLPHVQDSDETEVIGLDSFPVSPEPYHTHMLNHTHVDTSLSSSYDVLRVDKRKPESLAFARIDCAAVQHFVVRDHEIWVGEVERIDFDSSINDISSLDDNSPALVYYKRQFLRVFPVSAEETKRVLKHDLRHRMPETQIK